MSHDAEASINQALPTCPGLMQHRWRGFGAGTPLYRPRFGAWARPAQAPLARLATGPRPWLMGGRSRAAPKPLAYRPLGPGRCAARAPGGCDADSAGDPSACERALAEAQRVLLLQ